MLDGIVGAYLRYSASVFAHRLVRNREVIYRVHRQMAINCGRLYRIVSYYPATVIANYVPLDLSTAFHSMIRAKKQGWPLRGEFPVSVPDTDNITEFEESLRSRMKDEWQRRYDNCGHGAWTRRLIPVVGTCIEQLDYDLAQGLSGHGAFREYLYRFKRFQSPLCSCCQADETPEHVFAECEIYRADRPEVLSPVTDEVAAYLRSMVLNLWKREAEREQCRMGAR